MAADLISKKTRAEFRDYLVLNDTVRGIETLFDSADIDYVEIPKEKLFYSIRRSTVTCYYASIDWTNPNDIRKILNVYENVLMQIPDALQHNKSLLIRFLQKDGFRFENDRLVSKNLSVELSEIPKATDVLDTVHLHDYIERIKKSIDTDPALAIGSTKELVESTLKTILGGLAIEFEKDDDVPKLLKKVQAILVLAPEAIDKAAKGAETIRRVLSNLGSIVIAIAELRNLYGTGHGSTSRIKGLNDRHARLVVGAGATLCSFLLETYEARSRVKEKILE